MDIKLIFLILVIVFHKGESQHCKEPNGYFPHEKQCDRYYECVDGTATEKLCPDGLMFNDRISSKLRCDLPFDIDCSYRPTVQSAQSTENCPHLWGLYPDVYDCGKFYNCVDGFAHSFNCPEGLAWNDLNARCDWPDQVDSCDSEALLDFACPEPTENELVQFSDLRYPHPNDCKKFFVCVSTESGERRPRLLSCDFPRVFSYALNACDFVENVSGCENYYSSPKLDERRKLPPSRHSAPRGPAKNTGPSRLTGSARNRGANQNVIGNTGSARNPGSVRNTGSVRSPGAVRNVVRNIEPARNIGRTRTGR